MLQLLEKVQAIFSRPDFPFIVLLNLDPKVIDQSRDENLQDRTMSTSSGWGFLQNMVDLPLYLIRNPIIQNGEVNGAHTIKDVTFGTSRYCTVISHYNMTLFRSALPENFFDGITPKRLQRMKNIMYLLGRILRVRVIRHSCSLICYPRHLGHISLGISWGHGPTSQSSGLS